MAPDRVGPISFIFNAIKEGMNATNALEAYREAGGAIRTQRFYHAFGEVNAELAVESGLQSEPTNQVPSGEFIIDRGSGRPGAYLARGGVLISVRTVDPDTGKVSEQTMTNFGSVRYSVLPTIAQIQADIEAQFGPEGRSGVGNSTILGSFLSPILNLVEPTE
jgi:hypothetical protein